MCRRSSNAATRILNLGPLAPRDIRRVELRRRDGAERAADPFGIIMQNAEARHRAVTLYLDGYNDSLDGCGLQVRRFSPPRSYEEGPRIITNAVMTGLVPVIHVVKPPETLEPARNGAAWMAGTSPAMTERADQEAHKSLTVALHPLPLPVRTGRGNPLRQAAA